MGAYIHRLHLSIDFALAVSYRRNTFDGNAKFVARITLVKGIPFYGFHVGYQYYLKIYMLNPMVMTRLSDILRQGAVMKKSFQPYEAHLQYLLQWMADYNLYGCGFIDSKTVTFRSPVPQYDEMDNMAHLWHNLSIPEDLITDESVLPRVSHCTLEVDICVQDILNRKDIKPRPLHHDFVERFNPLAPDEKLVHSMAGLWRDETRRRKSRMSNSDPGSSPFPPEVMVSMSADPRNSQPGGWIHEAEYREKLHALILEEKNNSDGAKVSFQNFTRPTAFEASVRTSLEAVEDLYPENLRLALGSDTGTATGGLNYNANGVNGTDVDEKRIMGIVGGDDDSLQYDSDEETMREIELSQQKRKDKPEGKQPDLEINPEPDSDFDHVLPSHNVKDAEQSLQANTLVPEDLPSSQDLEAGVESIGSLHSSDRSKPDGKLAYQGIGEAQSYPDNVQKRPAPFVSSRESDSKRQKLSSEREDDGAIPHVEPLNLSREGLHHRRSIDSYQIDQTAGNSKVLKSRATTVNGHRTTSVPTNKKSSQESLKAGQAVLTQPLPFPITKDYTDSAFALRLSQKSASQSVQSGEKKHVTFDPSLQHTDVRPILHTSPGASSLNSSTFGNSIKFKNLGSGGLLFLRELPPGRQSIISTLPDHNLAPVLYQDAFYSNELDVPERAREWAGREFRLESTTVPFLPDFDVHGNLETTYGDRPSVMPDKAKEELLFQWQRRHCTLRSWSIAQSPPTYAEVLDWSRKETLERLQVPLKPLKPAPKSHIDSKSASKLKSRKKLSQVDGPTQKNKHGFKYTQNQKTTSVKHEAQYMSTMSLEIHVNTRGNFVPNPEEDEVQCIFWSLQSDDNSGAQGTANGTRIGVVVLSENGSLGQSIEKQVNVEVQEETSELDLMIRMVEIVRTHDPDILTGYEVHGGSWGYLIERARLKFEYNLCDEFSRMKAQSHGRFGKENDKWGFNNTSTIRVTGRHMINIWRAMRSELNLLQYTMENVVFHLLHQRIPHFTWADLTRWYMNDKPGDLAKVVSYYISRIQLDLAILEKNELIARTSEQARLLGVDFFSVFSRGSQFKVESLMFRIAKPENFLLVSPSRKQVGGQNALECLPLVMEPQSAYYNSPLLVLDFQSLYPSVMIAYNYCYSTFLGRVVNWRGTNKMGFTEFKRQERLLEVLKDHINIAPNGIMYTKPEIRKSLLAKMLGEILETRVMVKSGMKEDKDDKALQRLLNNRQLALKLIANVTYGYTSASFSGRMPCSEIADSIVQTGRETLEKAIALIHSVKRWGAEVVYGDTDSLFVYLKGRTKDQAFDIGEEIAKTVTNMNPRPVKLKFEKVYLPCVLLAKKRYVGFKYESRKQTEPDFDAKGIETVRRDGTPAEQKIEEKALKILFRTSDLTQVKEYFQQQCEKIMKGSVSVQDFCFAREVKLGTYSDKGPPPPGALISTKRMLADARAEPQYGERVPYVVITGAPGARLIDRCVAPEELLESDHSELDAEYYISKNIIPPLERIFNLVGANVRNWYDEMPKVQRIRRVDTGLQFQPSRELGISRKTLESYMKSSSCLVCKEKLELEGPICSSCLSNKPVSVFTLQKRMNEAEKTFLDLRKVCQGCAGLSPLDDVRCDSKDCPVFYTRTRQRAQLTAEKAVVEPMIRELSGLIIDMHDLEW